jgi:mannose-1-phosphate guanylyltransferase
MAERGEIWGVVLAAGDGTRLADATARVDGRPVPKQYCSLVEARSLLRATLDRLGALIPKERIVIVVAEAHRRHWERELADWPAENLVSQPENRGTAAGLLLPLLAIARRDPTARVVVSPSDHYFADEATFLATVRTALDSLAPSSGRLLLLGVAPDRVESGYGWIVPSASSAGASVAIERFVEKPDPVEASALKAAGALWNSFVIVSRLAALLDLYAVREPALLLGMSGAFGPSPAAADSPSSLSLASLRSLYDRLEARDFSRHLLAGAEDRLALIPIPPCGWTDLGTPERLAQVRAAREPSARKRVEYRLRRPPGRLALPALA